jgi:hypothetical protein
MSLSGESLSEEVRHDGIVSDDGNEMDSNPNPSSQRVWQIVSSSGSKISYKIGSSLSLLGSSLMRKDANDNKNEGDDIDKTKTRELESVNEKKFTDINTDDDLKGEVSNSSINWGSTLAAMPNISINYPSILNMKEPYDSDPRLSIDGSRGSF